MCCKIIIIIIIITQEDINISNPIFLKAIMYYNQTVSITGIQC